MSDENIYDLSKIASPSYDEERKVKNSSNQEISTEGYEQIDEKEWKFIPFGSYIRYLRKDGSFRKGGIVQGVWSNIEKNGNEVVKIDIAAAYGDKKWSITGTTIEKIWIKRAMRQTMGVSPEIREDIDNCKEAIKQLTIQIQKMNNEQIRIINLIKKLHNLK